MPYEHLIEKGYSKAQARAIMAKESGHFKPKKKARKKRRVKRFKAKKKILSDQPATKGGYQY